MPRRFVGHLGDAPRGAGGRFGLSRELWLVQIGVFLNMLGYGAVLPFEVIYLHDARGFGVGVAGAVVGALSGAAVVVAPFAGGLIDRVGARATAAAGGLALAGGYAGLAVARSPAVALAAAALGGAGNGALNPSQSALIAGLAPARLRHRATAVSRVATNAGIGLGSALGGAVAAAGVDRLALLFWANALTYLAYVAVLLAIVSEPARAERVRGGYRTVLRDRAFRRLALTNVAMIAVGWGVFSWLLPPFAKSLGVGAGPIGLLLLVNAATVVVAQVPIARLAEGRRRMAMTATGAGLFVVACGLCLAAPAGAALPWLACACAAVALGECCHTAVLMPLVAELAPPGLRGRYMAAAGLSWWLGLAAGPTLGAQLLAVSPTAAFGASAAVAAAAAAAALTLDPHLPTTARRTPIS